MTERRRDAAQQGKKAAFLLAFEDEGTVFHAAKRAGIDRTTHYRWLNEDPEYRAAFADAEETVVEKLEREGMRRAREGTDKPVFHQGEVVGHIREYSDTLLIFLLKARRPNVYRDRIDVTVDVRREIERLTSDPAEREAALAEVDAILAAAKS